MPFEGDSAINTGVNVVLRELSFPANDISPAAKDLLCGLLSKKPSSRITVQQIHAHEFFKGL